MPASMTGFRTGTHVFTTHDGERMVYYTLGDRSSPPVLLLHGCEHTVTFRRPSVCGLRSVQSIAAVNLKLYCMGETV
jgi:hypothetical protein